MKFFFEGVIDTLVFLSIFAVIGVFALALGISTTWLITQNFMVLGVAYFVLALSTFVGSGQVVMKKMKAWHLEK